MDLDLPEGHNGHLSSCPENSTCIQGTPEALRDSGISSSYTSTEITTTDLLTFSGSGDADSTVSTCSRDSLIPSNESRRVFYRVDGEPF